MAHGFSNRVWCATPTTGTGNVTIGTAKSAHCTPAQAGTPDGSTRTWLLEEGNDFEIFRGAYTASGTVVTRGTVLLSQIGGTTGTTKMTLAGTATIREVAAAEDLLSIVSPADARTALDVAAFGPTGTTLGAATDFDTIGNSGFYACQSPVNGGPAVALGVSGWTQLRVQSGGAGTNYSLQIANGLGSPQQFIRVNNGGVWGAWQQIATGATATGTALVQAADAAAARKTIEAAPFDAMASQNMMTNPFCDISQENGSSVVTGTLMDLYILDQWGVNITGPGMTGQQVSNPFPSVPGIAKGFKLNCVTAKPTLSATDFVHVFTVIEGLDSKCLAFGSSGAQPLSVGFYIRSNINMRMYVGLGNIAADRSYFTPVDLVANTDTWVPVLGMPGCPDGTWSNTNSGNLVVFFQFGTGSTFQGTINTWNSANLLAGSDVTNLGAVLNNNIIMSGLMIIPGTELPPAARVPYTTRPYAEELLRCKRYFESSYESGIVPGTASQISGAEVRYVANSIVANQNYGAVPIVTKRAPPTVTIYGYQGGSGKVSDATPSDLAAGSGTAALIGSSRFSVFNNSGGAITTTNNLVLFHWAAKARMS